MTDVSDSHGWANVPSSKSTDGHVQLASLITFAVRLARGRLPVAVSAVEVAAVGDVPLQEERLSEVHLLVQQLEREINEVIPSARVMIHPDAHGLRDETDVLLEAEVRGDK